MSNTANTTANHTTAKRADETATHSAATRANDTATHAAQGTAQGTAQYNTYDTVAYDSASLPNITSSSNRSQEDQATSKRTAAQLRHEAVAIVQRHRRGLPGTLTDAAPAPAAPTIADAARSLEEAQRLLAAGRYGEALLRADTTIGLAPPGSDLLADGWALHGQVRLLQGNPKAARASLERALVINPAHLPARLALADAYQQLHQPARAVPLYLEALALMQDEGARGQVRLALATAYRRAGQPDAARRVLRTHTVGQLSLLAQLRALLRWLLPARPLEALLLFCACLLPLAIAMEQAWQAAAGVAALAMLAYVLLLWWWARG